MDVVISGLIGFLYSSIIALIIYYLTKLYETKKYINNMEINLTKYIFSSDDIKSMLIKLSKINGYEYRKFFGEVLDGKKINEMDYNIVPEFIIFDSVPLLPELDDYLVNTFIEELENKINKNSEEEILNLLKLSKEEKDEFIIEKNIGLILCKNLNRKIQKLNEMLDYYRYLTKEIISFNRFDAENETQKLKRQFIVFKYCIENIISESNGILSSLNIVDKTLFQNKRKIKKKGAKLNKKYSWIARILIIAIISSLFIIIARLL